MCLSVNALWWFGREEALRSVFSGVEQVPGCVCPANCVAFVEQVPGCLGGFRWTCVPQTVRRRIHVALSTYWAQVGLSNLDVWCAVVPFCLVCLSF